MASNALLKSQPPCCPPSTGPQSLARGKRWALAIALKHGHLGQKDRGTSHGPQASAHHLEPFIRPKGLLSRKDRGTCAEWKEAGVEGLEQCGDQLHYRGQRGLGRRL